MTEPSALSADRPSTDPANDLFNHAPFARTLAKAVQNYRLSDGIVLALYGPWGSGKSTVLAYVQHELEQLEGAARPVVVTFNPWWFSGHDNLAKSFLGQLQAVLPEKYGGFTAVGNKLAEFSDALGGAVDLASTVLGVPLGGKLVEQGFKALGTKPKDVPALKRSLSDLLVAEAKRVLVIIDDIDRLTPEEVRQLFTVIKALADFPYVTYLLAFDREVAATAISEQTGLPGDRYLEKIIQVPFELPSPDRIALQQALTIKLNAVFADTAQARLDSVHWHNIYRSGLEPLIAVPRDVVRLANVLSVTYSAVCDEVNPADFIAIEALRVFLPSVYDAIRTSPEQFVGQSNIGTYDRGESKQAALAFHDGWLSSVPKHLQASTKDMVRRLFPRLDSVWANMYYAGNSATEWRRELRVCSPDIFPAYFRLSLPQNAVSRLDIDAFLRAKHSSGAIADLLRRASIHKSANGFSKASALLERLGDHVGHDIVGADVEAFVQALHEMGDELLVEGGSNQGVFGFDDELRITGLTSHLLSLAAPAQRGPLLLRTIAHAKALRCAQVLISALMHQCQRSAEHGTDALVSQEEVDALKAAWCARLRQASKEDDLIRRPTVTKLLHDWRAWGDPTEAVAWWQEATSSDEGLLQLIAAQASVALTRSDSDLVWRNHLRVDPAAFQPYGDVQAMAERVRGLLERNEVPASQHSVAVEFERACQSLASEADRTGAAG